VDSSASPKRVRIEKNRHEAQQQTSSRTLAGPALLGQAVLASGGQRPRRRRQQALLKMARTCCRSSSRFSA